MNTAQAALYNMSNTAHTFNLSHVHGMCSVPGTHTHVHYLNRGSEIVYSAGKIVILQDIRSNKKQRFFKLHNYEIKGLCVCEERSIVCSGDINNQRPTVYVWDAITLLPLHQIRGFHQNGIQHLSMSIDGSLVLSCGLDTNHSIAVHRLWYVSGGVDYDSFPSNSERSEKDKMSPNCECELLFTSPTSEEKVCHTLILRNNDLVTCGPRHVTFWISEDGGGTQVRQGQLPSSWISVPMMNNDDDDNENEQDEEPDEEQKDGPPPLHFTPFGGVFHRTVGRRVVTCLAESPPPSGYGLMASERDGRMVCGCGATANGGSGDLIMFRINDRQCTGSVRAHLGHVLSVDWCEGDPDYGMYARTCKTPATPQDDGSAMEYGGGRIVSGGADGLVKLWTGNLDLLAEFDITVHGTISPICLNVRWCPGTILKDRKDDLMGIKNSKNSQSDSKYFEELLSNTEPLSGLAASTNDNTMLTKTVREREERKRALNLSRMSERSFSSRGGSTRGSSRGGAIAIANANGYLASQVIQPLLVCTAGEIIEMDPRDGAPLHECPLQQTHCIGKVRALAVHPQVGKCYW